MNEMLPSIHIKRITLYFVACLPVFSSAVSGSAEFFSQPLGSRTFDRISMHQDILGQFVIGYDTKCYAAFFFVVNQHFCDLCNGECF